MDQETIYIQQVVAGDVNRYAYFVEKYQKMAFATAMGILGNEADAEEAVQDAFLKAFRGLGSFRGGAKFSTWLCKITINCALGRVGSRGSRDGGSRGGGGSRAGGGFVDIELADEHLADVDSGYKRLNDQDQARCIREALDRMDVEDRLVLTLYYLNEQSIEEISAATVWSRDVIKMRLHRARKRMYGILSRMPELKNV